MHAWGKAAGDRGPHIADWICKGAPSGIDVSIAEPDGLFPIFEDEYTTEPDALWTDRDAFSNHETVEDDDEVVELVCELVEDDVLEVVCVPELVELELVELVLDVEVSE